MKPLRIYLADLTHTGNGLATESIPLNIGLIASYAKKVFGDAITVRLFKYPEKLLVALQSEPPDILGCSNYVWNSALSYRFCEIAKRVNPETLTVMGGPNYPIIQEAQWQFDRTHPLVDEFLTGHAEWKFSAMVKVLLSGNYFLLPIKSLDDIPSPYATGLLDEFFDGHLAPLVETTHGCPFHCNFCNAGDDAYNRVSTFSDEYVREELTYIAKKSVECGVSHLTFADNNFGMLERDGKTAELLQELRQKYGWPKSVSIPIGKAPKDRVIKTTRILGDLTHVSMNVQSMDEKVLKTIRRKNLPMDAFRTIMSDLESEGRMTSADVIVPLPRETLESYLKGVNQLIDLGITQILSHTLQMNYGTPYRDDPEFRKRHGYVTKFRVVPLDFSLVDGKSILDVEEVGVATDTFSFEDYLRARAYQFVIDLCCNSRRFDPLRKFLNATGTPHSHWVEVVFNSLEEQKDTTNPVLDVWDKFKRETASELWDSEECLREHYSDPRNYERLLSYESGGNVIYKHRTLMFTHCWASWAGLVFETVHERFPRLELFFGEELDEVERYSLSLAPRCLGRDEIDDVVIGTFSYDIPAWMQSPRYVPLDHFAKVDPVQLRFFFPDESKTVLRDAFTHYGTDLAGLAKMMQRVKASHYTRQVEKVSF